MDIHAFFEDDILKNNARCRIENIENTYFVTICSADGQHLVATCLPHLPTAIAEAFLAWQAAKSQGESA